MPKMPSPPAMVMPERKRKGRKSTILTTSSGLQDEPELYQKTLLGN